MDAEQKTFRLMTLQSRLLHGEVLREKKGAGTGIWGV